MMLADQDERAQALNVCESFCISAPAGSGKTALLVQRTLALLARVDNPESVVAVTFTRKAAAEMRARMVFWLRSADMETVLDDAAEAEGAQVVSEHEQNLLQLARHVLARDQQRGWGLAANPSRLRIRTIDSFCRELTRQMPILSGSGGQLTPRDNSDVFYREAIQRFLSRELDATDPARRADIKLLMLHLDNQWEGAVELLMGLLRRREQWQPVFGGGLDDQDHAGIRELTEALVAHRLGQLREHLGPWLGELMEIMDYRQQQLPDSAAFDPELADLRVWQELRAFFLTNAGTPRKTLTKREGFPAGKGAAADNKSRALALIQAVQNSDDTGLLAAIAQLQYLPNTDIDSAHWEVLAALTRLLPRLGAELLLVFQSRGEVDHAQIAMAAIAALGDDDAPTDIALRLDHSIEHLLVDEFQDTSSLQFELIRRITRGWHDHNRANPAAPRTLLLVGDAMQSIYGFRAANVGLFIQARSEGIGDLPLKRLDLSVNFRSRASIVDWVNKQFTGAFPAADDAALGAVRFRSASAMRADNENGSNVPELRLFSGDDASGEEVRQLCDKVEEGLADEAVTSIAILGRSRTQLHPVLAELRARNVEVTARDLDPLGGRPIIRDLVTLCGVLFDRFDRLSWLSLLRCPAIALDHSDLLQVALHAPLAHDLLVSGPRAAAALGALSDTGRERMQRLGDLLRWAGRYQDRLSLRVWVEECWLRFGGAASIQSAADHKDVEQFFQCLETLEQTQQQPCLASLQESVDTLYAAPADERCKVQVMTLHKAKGLEFDWVFIPSLSRSTRGNDKELLLWEELTLPGRSPVFLLDVRSSAHADDGARLYDYLRAQGQQRQRLEASRLFYVGCTRAADYLWLSATLSWDEEKQCARAPGSASLLACIWEGLGESVDVHHVPAPLALKDAEPAPYLRLQTLPELDAMPEFVSSDSAPVDLDDASRLPRAFGTALHRALESLVYRDELPKAGDPHVERILNVSLRQLGVPEGSLEELQHVGMAALDKLLLDPWARWMLAPERGERYAELALTVANTSHRGQLVLDYVFLDEVRNERWVVDYKTASPQQDETREDFMQRQLASYGEQLAGYVKALSLRFKEPVRCALYFTALGQHCEWEPSLLESGLDSPVV